MIDIGGISIRAGDISWRNTQGKRG